MPGNYLCAVPERIGSLWRGTKHPHITLCWLGRDTLPDETLDGIRAAVDEIQTIHSPFWVLVDKPIQLNDVDVLPVDGINLTLLQQRLSRDPRIEPILRATAAEQFTRWTPHITITPPAPDPPLPAVWIDNIELWTPAGLDYTRYLHQP